MASIITAAGFQNMYRQDTETFVQAIMNNFGDFVTQSIFGALGFTFLEYLLNFGEYQILRAWQEKIIAYMEMTLIFSNLEEGIISKRNDSFGFCNIKGTKMIDSLKKIIDEKNTYVSDEE